VKRRHAPSAAPATTNTIPTADTDIEWIDTGPPAADEEPGAEPEPAADESDPPRRVTDDGRRRRRRALGVVGVAVLSAVVGVVVGGRLKSPSDRANERKAPPASRITVPVARRTLASSVVLAGEIAYAEPTPIKLAGTVGVAEGETAVVTRLPEVDQPVAEGDVLLEVSGRPVFVLQGALPTYRSLGPGATGGDVQQLEEALQRLGLDPGAVDTTYDAATQAAIGRLYTSKGHTAIGPTPEEDDRLRAARQTVTDAEDTVRVTQDALVEAGKTADGAELLALQQGVSQARDAVTQAEQAAQRNNDAAAAAVTNATSARDAAATTRDATKARFDTASAPGAVDPTTGEPYSSDEIESRRIATGDAQANLAAAEAALDEAQTAKTATAAEGTAAVKLARDARALAEAQLADGTKAPDTSAAQRAVDDANAALTQATTDLADTEAQTGIRVPAGEIVFVPTLPSTVTAVDAVVGGPATEALVTVSTSDTQIIGRVARADAALVVVGASVTVELRDSDVTFPGTIASVGPIPSTSDQSGGSGNGSDSGGGPGRQQVVVTPTDPAAVRDHVFASVRIVVDVASTGGEVLVVPVAAVSIGGDGGSRVEVEREPVTADDPGRTEFVKVEPGLSADGLVEVRPTAGALEEGDRVVVGTAASTRRNTSSEGDDTEPSDEPATTEAPTDSTEDGVG
jgi:multidrug efflux pump subunit AcrA (membrane-fusion protein)